MANKTMNFGVDLLPTSTNTYNLGNADHKWKINGETPVLTDINVKQNNQTDNNDYRLLLSGNANDNPEITVVNKSTNLKFNPFTKLLSVGGDISATGNLTITGNTNLNNETYADSLTAGSLLVTGNSNFTQIPTAPTPANLSNDTSIATTAFVKNSISSLSNAMHFIGKATVAIADGSTTDPAISGYSTKVAGDVVIDKDTSYEYVWTAENKWERLGPDSSYSLSTHTHGNISNDGKITSTATIANGDKLVIVDVDSTAGSKLTGSSITFDGSTETNCLTQKGTWKPFNNYAHPTGDGDLHVPATGTSNNGKFLKAGSTAGSLSWANAVTSITLKAGDGISLDTNNTAITTTGTRTISHAVPTGASATTLGNSTTRYYIKTITTDKFGHVTGVTTGNETVTNSDTKNTAGSTDTSSKIFLIGATSQAASSETYSDDEVFATDGVLTAKTFNSTSLTASYAVSTDANKNLVSTNLTVSDPAASGTGISYISSIEQSAVGKITATKSTVRSASTSQTGVVQLDSAINSTSETLAATSKAVKTAYDLANDHKYWANIEATSAASYNKAPEMASIKLNGNTSATVASTSNVSLVFNSTTNALDFVFA